MAELAREGTAYDRNIKVGLMIEVPCGNGGRHSGKARGLLQHRNQ